MCSSSVLEDSNNRNWWQTNDRLRNSDWLSDCDSSEITVSPRSLPRLLVSLSRCWQITVIIIIPECWLAAQKDLFTVSVSTQNTQFSPQQSLGVPRAQVLFTVKCLLETREKLGLCARAAHGERTVLGLRALEAALPGTSQARSTQLPAVSRTIQSFSAKFLLTKNQTHRVSIKIRVPPPQMTLFHALS